MSEEQRDLEKVFQAFLENLRELITLQSYEDHDHYGGHYSKAHIAKRAGISLRTLSRFEKGHDIKLSIALKIIAGLGIDPEVLLAEDGGQLIRLVYKTCNYRLCVDADGDEWGEPCDIDAEQFQELRDTQERLTKWKHEQVDAEHELEMQRIDQCEAELRKAVQDEHSYHAVSKCQQRAKKIGEETYLLHTGGSIVSQQMKDLLAMATAMGQFSERKVAKRKAEQRAEFDRLSAEVAELNRKANCDE